MNLPKSMHVGPGGIDCPCCFPQNRKLRRAAIRAARRRANREILLAEEAAYGTPEHDLFMYDEEFEPPFGDADEETLAQYLAA